MDARYRSMLYLTSCRILLPLEFKLLRMDVLLFNRSVWTTVLMLTTTRRRRLQSIVPTWNLSTPSRLKFLCLDTISSKSIARTWSTLRIPNFLQSKHKIQSLRMVKNGSMNKISRYGWEQKILPRWFTRMDKRFKNGTIIQGPMSTFDSEKIPKRPNCTPDRILEQFPSKINAFHRYNSKRPHCSFLILWNVQLLSMT